MKQKPTPEEKMTCTLLARELLMVIKQKEEAENKLNAFIENTRDLMTAVAIAYDALIKIKYVGDKGSRKIASDCLERIIHLKWGHK